MTTLTISLPDSLKVFIDREVDTKGYGNVSEYVRGLLRQAQANEADARLEALLSRDLPRGRTSLFLRNSGANCDATRRRFKPGKSNPKEAGHVHAGLLDTSPSKSSKLGLSRF